MPGDWGVMCFLREGRGDWVLLSQSCHVLSSGRGASRCELSQRR